MDWYFAVGAQISLIMCSSQSLVPCHAGHVHASTSHRSLFGQDQVDWIIMIDALKEINYDGNIVMASFAQDNEVITRTICIWRSLISPEQLAVEGLCFLGNKWNMKESVRSIVQT